MDASCLRFCCSFFHLVAPYQTWQLLSSPWCPAHLRYLCSIPWAWVLFWCSSAMADSSNLHCKVYYWDVSQDVRAKMATAKWLSTSWLKTTGLALFTTLSAVTMRKQHQAMFYVTSGLGDESSFWHWELQRKEQNWAAPAGSHKCCGSGYRDKSG